MYVAKAYQNRDPERAFELIRRHPFATLVSLTSNSEPFVSHLPLILDRTPDGATQLLGHMARANPHWKHLEENPRTKIIFHGPQTYITPNWYAEHDVPTWNYATVHVDGRVSLLGDYESTLDALRKATVFFESHSDSPWEFRLPEDLASEKVLLAAIIAFEIQIENITAKFKLGQNRSEADQLGMIRGLESRSDDQSREVLELIRRERG